MASLILLQGGEVVTPQGLQKADVLIQNELIQAVGIGLAAQAGEAVVQDITGLTILPGLIDVHTHLREPGGEHKEDFYTGTCAALAGGVTTVLAMPNTEPPVIDAQILHETLRLASEKAACDFGLYVGGTIDNAEKAAALTEAVGLKLYIGSSTGSLLLDQFPAQYAHFSRYPADRVLAVHAEDEAAVQHFAAMGQRRPPLCALLATAHVLALAEHFGRRIHICHISTSQELALIRDARTRGVKVTCEVTPHHLFLSTRDEEQLGSLGRVNPPLRDQEDVDAIWADHFTTIDMVATDHAPHTLAEKASASPPSGMPGLETMLPLLLTAAHEGRLTLPDIARLTASNPAQTFRLAHKGRIAPGYHADLTLVNRATTWTVAEDSLFTKCRWNPFLGRQMHGKVAQVYLRGECVFEGGKVMAHPGYGNRVIQTW